MKSSNTDTPVWKVVIGCIGGLLIHLVVGSLYQWGTINVYVASFYKITQPDIRLENTGVVFPLMMTCIGIGMRPGISLSNRIGAFWTLLGIELVAAMLVLASSFIPTFVGFVAVFGALFGLISGMAFMLPMIECNKYLPGKRMYINGLILIGTGMSPAIFGEFSYNILNPDKLPSNLGYYDGNLTYISLKLPQLIRYLSLFYVSVGILGCFLLLPVILHNQSKQRDVTNLKIEMTDISLGASQGSPEKRSNTLTDDSPERPKKFLTSNEIQNDSVLEPTIPNIGSPERQDNLLEPSRFTMKVVQVVSHAPVVVEECPSYAVAFKSSVCWVLALCVVLNSCGNLLLNGNYKTYVKKQITDDNYLTLIGAIGAIGNGCTRFFWNMLFNKIGFRSIIATMCVINIAAFVAINFSTGVPQLYCFLIFLINACLGGMLVVTPTVCLNLYGSVIGAGIYSFYWICFSIANFIGYLLVSRLSLVIGMNNILYVVVGMAASVLLIVAFYKFQPKWQKPSETSVVPASAA